MRSVVANICEVGYVILGKFGFLIFPLPIAFLCEVKLVVQYQSTCVGMSSEVCHSVM